MKLCMGCMSHYDEKLAECPVCGYSETAAVQQARKAPDALKIETILQGRFVIGRILSINYFSILYIAWDALLSRRVVIRELYPYDYTKREGSNITARTDEAGEVFRNCISQFKEEIELLSSCQYLPFVLNYYRFFFENGTIYAYTEYLEGMTLRDVCQNNMADELKENYISEIRKCIRKLHDRQVIHGNISPSSIYVCKDGSLKLIDFGMTKRWLCRQIGNTRDIIDASYSAPELLEANISNAIDIYSAGAVFYWMISGKEPESTGRRRRFADKKAKRLFCRMTDRDPDLRELNTE